MSDNLPETPAGQGLADAPGSACECARWCRSGQEFLTEHHRGCARYDPERDARAVITALLRGIEAWASDEDGVHPDCWEAYKRAKISVWQGHDIREAAE